jgi:hypothetical protein
VNEKNYQVWMTTVEAAAREQRVAESAVVHELDRMAEHLVGETAPEAQQVKMHVQQLLTQLAPERQHLTLYAERYCSGGR